MAQMPPVPFCLALGLVLLAPAFSCAATIQKIETFFGGNGANPQGKLLRDANGNLYGTTYNGGSGPCADPSGCGLVFELVPTGTDGSKSYNRSTLHLFKSKDGANPIAGLAFGDDGMLYGTTVYGRLDNCEFGCGEVFKLDPATRKLTILHSFTGGADGNYPFGGVLSGGNGTFYGTTASGGTNNCGTLFKLAPRMNGSAGYKLTTLHTFSQSEGCYPLAALTADNDGALYGTTSSGGSLNDGGIAFKFDPMTRAMTTLYVFGGWNDGYSPGPMVFGADGFLYGLTGAVGFGAATGSLFKIDPINKTSTPLYYFGRPGPSAPGGALTVGTGGVLYGTSAQGGENDAGTVFAFDPSISTMSTVYSFTYKLGEGLNRIAKFGMTPEEGVVIDGDGALYGTTSNGGDLKGNGRGTVFKLTP